jgi:hypothetical protein
MYKTGVLGGLDWKWKHGYNYMLYHLLFLAILFNFYNYSQITIYFIASYILYNLSITRVGRPRILFLQI